MDCNKYNQPSQCTAHDRRSSWRIQNLHDRMLHSSVLHIHHVQHTDNNHGPKQQSSKQKVELKDESTFRS